LVRGFTSDAGWRGGGRRFAGGGSVRRGPAWSEGVKFQANVLLIVMVAVVSRPSAFVAAKEPLSIRVSPAMSFAPANLVIRTRVEPDASNRAVEIVADSDQFYRSSVVQLDGERAPRTSMFEFRSLPPGVYEVKAALIGADGRARATARGHVIVAESGVSR